RAAVAGGVVADRQCPRAAGLHAFKPGKPIGRIRLMPHTDGEAGRHRRRRGVVQRDVHRRERGGPTSLNRPTVFPLGEVNVTSRSTGWVWLRLIPTHSRPIRAEPGTLIVDVTVPTSGIMNGEALVYVAVVAPHASAGM